MPIKILMPALSPTMTEGNLAKWHVKEGDKVKAGELIAEIETDKATMEVEAVDEGKIGKLLFPAGSKNVKVNSVIAVLLEEGEDKSVIDKMDLTVKEPVKQAPKEEKVEIKAALSVSHSQPQSRIFASPLAKRLATENNVNLNKVVGSGPKGRVVKSDIQNYVEKGGGSKFTFSSSQINRAHPEISELPISTMRQVIAKRLVESKQNVPHFYLSVDCNMDKLLQMRADVNSLANQQNPEFKISVNDMVIKASALALKFVPEANLSWAAEGLIQYNNIDISVAVAIDGGLITPIVRNADQKSLFVISEEMKGLVHKAKSGALTPEEFQGGSFSISNLGMYGIKNFKAIINPPQSCILPVGATIETPIVKDGKIEIANIMTITISCDHRAVDGAVAAKLINEIKNVIENPVRMLI